MTIRRLLNDHHREDGYAGCRARSTKGSREREDVSSEHVSTEPTRSEIETRLLWLLTTRSRTHFRRSCS